MRYGVSTHLAPEKVIEKAVEYFEKLGLEVTQRDEDSVCMEGGGGHVTLSVCGEDKMDVDILTEEWDQKVKEFIQRIGD
ncbi:MAG TPA: hypothetical protein VMW26_07565 [Methanomassiliicoccales archaeon]|nr:hypothetical protein [Methanomassiliicoccales archaeon]